MTDPEAVRRIVDFARSEVQEIVTVVAVVQRGGGALVLFSEARAGEFGVAVLQEIGGEWELLGANGGFQAECELWIADPHSSGDRGVGVYCREVGSRADIAVVCEGRRLDAETINGWVVAFDWDVAAEHWVPVLAEAS